MKQFTTTARSYHLFNQIAQALQSSLTKKIQSAFGFSAEQLASRLTQRVVALGLAPFMQLSGAGKIQHDVLALKTLTLRRNVTNWRIRVSSGFFLKNLVDYYIHVFCNVCVLLFAATVARVKSVSQPATLVFGLGMESLDAQHGYAAFIDFCKRSEITVLNSASRLLLHTGQKTLPSACGYLNFHRFPLYALMIGTPLSLTRFAHAVGLLLKNLAEFHIFLIKHPEASLLSREIAMLPLIDTLNAEKMIENVVLTNSVYEAQALWLRPFKGRNFEAHMIFYSQNTVPFIYEEFSVNVPLPNNVFLFSDHYWIWTTGFKEYLSDLGLQGKFHVVGPILWYLVDIESYKKNNKSGKTITIFDVTPVNNDYAKSIGFIDNYYSVENCNRFVNDIVSVVEDINSFYNLSIDVQLKPKRNYQTNHDSSYISLIKKLNESCKLKFIEHNKNIFELINQSDLIIVIPYSSPALIAEYLNVPAIYFDSTSRLCLLDNKLGSIELISGKQRLADIVKKRLLKNT